MNEKTYKLSVTPHGGEETTSVVTFTELCHELHNLADKEIASIRDCARVTIETIPSNRISKEELNCYRALKKLIPGYIEKLRSPIVNEESAMWMINTLNDSTTIKNITCEATVLKTVKPSKNKYKVVIRTNNYNNYFGINGLVNKIMTASEFVNFFNDLALKEAERLEKEKLSSNLTSERIAHTLNISKLRTFNNSEDDIINVIIPILSGNGIFYDISVAKN